VNEPITALAVAAAVCGQRADMLAFEPRLGRQDGVVAQIGTRNAIAIVAAAGHPTLAELGKMIGETTVFDVVITDRDPSGGIMPGASAATARD
jgi:hypothetical protein